MLELIAIFMLFGVYLQFVKMRNTKAAQKDKLNRIQKKIAKLEARERAEAEESPS